MSISQEVLTANLVLPIIKDLVLPKIQAVFKKSPTTSVNEKSVEEQLHDYLTRRYTKFLTIDTLVFANMQTQLEILYQPLTISCKEGITGEEVNIKIDCYPENLLPNYARVIIEDTAGMGKSTITKKLFQSIIEQKAGIPVLIELSQIKKKNSILKEIQSQMSQIGKQINQDIILKLINEGDFIFLFDGYDEIALADREFTIRELHRFIEKADDNYFLITSRPEDSLASFGDFQKFSVSPLKNDEAFELLKKYDMYGHKKIADSLIQKLKESDETLQEYLNNPFLVSLLYKSYEYKKDIPVKKSQFYEQVYDALFEAHDLSKDGYLKREKYCKLHKDDFEQVLRAIAYFSSMANKIEYDKNTIIQFIKKAKIQTSSLKFKESDYLKDLLNTVPLFKKEGNNFKWAHKSLQDYFAAKFIWVDAKESRIDILKKIYEDEENQRFFNVLLLYCELDRKGFEYTILKWFLEKFRDYDNTSYNDFSKTKKLVKERVVMHFNKNIEIINIRKKGLEMQIFNSFIKRNPLNYSSRSMRNLNVSGPYTMVINSSVKSISLQNVVRLIKEIFSDITEEVKRPERRDCFILDLEKNKLHRLDDNSINLLNSDDCFQIMNNVLCLSNERKKIINYDKALAKLKQLEKNNPEKEKDELLDW
ncbi:NACHT domain-containing NTPase [uncultured Kordia sp.]|uniref:NACHT domain-containing protein n=1 Tax=uncultured Kordia sp. TaxID=507699 RepID=UPI00261BBF04|nr:NACHT domain-containing protein [uncultured Kordia sp.]